MSVKVRLTCVLVISLLALAVGCTPGRKTFAESWKIAVEKSDARLAWNLLDSASRGRIVTALKRTQGKAKQSEEFRHLFSFVNAPADVNLPTEELAIALLGQQLTGKEKQIVDDGKTTLIHIESGKWVASVEPVGFFDPDGAALTLAIRLRTEGTNSNPGPAVVAEPVPRKPGFIYSMEIVEGAIIRVEPNPGSKSLLDIWKMKDSQGNDISKMTQSERDVLMGSDRLIKDTVEGFKIYPIAEGETFQVGKAEGAKAAAVMAEQLRLQSGFEMNVKRLMEYYIDQADKKKEFDYFAFAVDRSGGFTISTDKFNPALLHSQTETQHFNFGAWPAPL